MLSLDSKRWANLHHAGGRATAVPGWLRQLESAGAEDAMVEIWGVLCHQYSVYSATFAAIPHIVRIADSKSIDQRIDPLIFVGTVVAWARIADFEGVAEDLQRWYEMAIQRAGELSIQAWRSSALDQPTAIDLLAAIAGLKGCRGLGRILPWLNSEELTPLCSGCDRELYVWPKENGLRTAAEDPVFHKQTTWVDVRPRSEISPPWDGTDYSSDNSFVWLSSLAAKAGHEQVALWLRYLFGVAVCPACRCEFDLMPRLIEMA